MRVGKTSILESDKGFRIWDNFGSMGDWRSGSAGALQAQGRGFKSLIAHHRNLKAEALSFGFFCARTTSALRQSGRLEIADDVGHVATWVCVYASGCR